MGYAPLEETKELKQACSEIIEGVISGHINKKNLDEQKILIARKYGINKVLKNAEIFHFASKDESYRFLRDFFRIKPVRTASGVANIAVMWLGPDGYSCPGKCIYCLQGKNSPKSYTGREPTTMRAIRNNYDPFLQVVNRLKQLKIIGHSTDKCELIIMGGTFPSMPFSFQEKFVQQCLDAMNGCSSNSLEQAQELNENAKNRCIGLTIETRADFCSDEHIEEMLKLGCTRVELGLQTTSEEIMWKIKRGYTTEENKLAIKRLRDAGLKVTVHWMPGLTGLNGKIDLEAELEQFKALFDDADYRPDEIKIYPVLVLPGTELYELWKTGKYAPINSEQMMDLLINMKCIVPLYVRIKRIMRDIPQDESLAGASTTNLRQLAKQTMEQKREKCRCIRCREIGMQEKIPVEPAMHIADYDASGGKEFFLSFENKEQEILLGFLRLRTGKKAFVRELHVYGELTPIGEATKNVQHTGLGKRLIKKAEEIAKMNNFDQLFITSGIGVRRYYENLGYKRQGNYMAKTL